MVFKLKHRGSHFNVVQGHFGEAAKDAPNFEKPPPRPPPPKKKLGRRDNRTAEELSCGKLCHA